VSGEKKTTVSEKKRNIEFKKEENIMKRKDKE